MTTFEIIGSTDHQRLGLVQNLDAHINMPKIEPLDEDTFNITVPDGDADTVTEWAEQNNLQCRLV